MFEALGFFVLGLLMLALGGDSVVKGAAGLAQRFGMSPFTAGLGLVAVATSVPEIAVNLQAVARGQQQLALGNAIGSNVVNVGLTLGVAALCAPLLVRWRALRPLWWMLLIGTIAVIVMGLDGVLSQLEGALLLAAFVAVLAFALSRAHQESEQVRDEVENFARTSTDLTQNLLRLLFAAVLLYFGTRFVVVHAATLGSAMGLSPLLTGLLPVAIATALPEVAGAVVAARRGQGDLVAGHVVGSSVVNLLLVVGGMAAYNAVPLPASFIRYELPAAAVFALLLFPVLRGDWRVSRGEGGALLAAFVAGKRFGALRLGP